MAWLNVAQILAESWAERNGVAEWRFKCVGCGFARSVVSGTAKPAVAAVRLSVNREMEWSTDR